MNIGEKLANEIQARRSLEVHFEDLQRELGNISRRLAALEHQGTPRGESLAVNPQQTDALSRRVSLLEKASIEHREHTIRFPGVLADHSARIAALEDRSGTRVPEFLPVSSPRSFDVDSLVPTVAKAHEAPDAADAPVDDAAKEKAYLDLNELEQEEMVFNESIWDAAFFIGTQPLGCGGSLMGTCLLMLNIFVQVVFCLLIFKNFLRPYFEDDDLDGLLAWRYKVAHDQTWVSSMMDNSLDARVCGQDPTLAVSYAQVDYLNTIEDYIVIDEKRGIAVADDEIGKYLTGPLMCCLALICWCLSVFKELFGIFDWLIGVLKLPKGQMKWNIDEDGGIELIRVSWSRVGWASVVACIRIWVAGFLAFNGLWYIKNIVAMEDMLLNAVALEFVLQVDELIFAALAPVRTRNFMARLKPLPLRRYPHIAGADARHMFCVFVLVGAVLYLRYFQIADVRENLLKAWDHMCEGERDFIYTLDTMGLVLVQTGMPEFDEDQTVSDIIADLPAQAIHEAIFQPNSSIWSYALYEPMYATIITAGASPPYTRAQAVRTGLQECLDVFLPPDQSVWADKLYRQYLNAAWNRYRVYQIFLEDLIRSIGDTPPDGGVNYCADIARYCTYPRVGGSERFRLFLAARAWCPETCGCHDPILGAALTGASYGCPSSCAQAIGLATAEATTCTADPTGNATGALLQYATELGVLTQHTALSRGLLEHSCAYLASSPSAAAVYCYDYDTMSGVPDFKSMLLMCPEACGCTEFNHGSRPSACPGSCYHCVNYLTARDLESLGLSLGDGFDASTGECTWSAARLTDPWDSSAALSILLSTVSYTRTSNHQYCEPGQDITDQAQCQSGASALGLAWAGTFNGPDDHKFCLFADDSRQSVFFNTAGNSSSPTPPQVNYASLCQQVAGAANPVDELGCLLIQAFAQYEFNKLSNSSLPSILDNVNAMQTICSPCRRESFVQTLGSAEVTIARSSARRLQTQAVCARPSTGCMADTDNYQNIDCDGDGVLDHMCTTSLEVSKRWLVLSSEGCPGSWGASDRTAAECQAPPTPVPTPPATTTTITTTRWPQPPWSGDLWSIGNFFTDWQQKTPEAFADIYHSAVPPDPHQGAAPIFHSREEFVEAVCLNYQTEQQLQGPPVMGPG